MKYKLSFQAREYVHDFFESLGWTTSWDSFSERTPLGQKNFHNLVVSVDEGSSKDLVLACHFDSKILSEGPNIAATDSAVPCAMMMDLASVMSSYLKQRMDKTVGLKMVFFDGEEAFGQWTDSDSLYGSRHLAAKWEQQLDTVDVLMLLDLLGAKNPRIINGIEHKTEELFAGLVEIEQSVLAAGCAPTVPNVFLPGTRWHNVIDDHVPFMKRGVPILHLIASPFPSVWHSTNDNEQALDYATIDHLNAVLRIFVSRYFNIQTNVC